MEMNSALTQKAKKRFQTKQTHSKANYKEELLKDKLVYLMKQRV